MCYNFRFVDHTFIVYLIQSTMADNNKYGGVQRMFREKHAELMSMIDRLEEAHRARRGPVPNTVRDSHPGRVDVLRGIQLPSFEVQIIPRARAPVFVLPLTVWTEDMESTLVILNSVFIQIGHFNFYFIHRQRSYIRDAFGRAMNRDDVFNQIFTGEFLGKSIREARKKKAVLIFCGMYYKIKVGLQIFN